MHDVMLQRVKRELVEKHNRKREERAVVVNALNGETLSNEESQVPKH